jgi:hypothetical protein
MPEPVVAGVAPPTETMLSVFILPAPLIIKRAVPFVPNAKSRFAV